MPYEEKLLKILNLYKIENTIFSFLIFLYFNQNNPQTLYFILCYYKHKFHSTELCMLTLVKLVN